MTTQHKTTEQDRALLLQAALEVAGIDEIIPIKEPLPKERRQHLYVVPDTHELGKIYGVSQLSSALRQTKCPHLTDYDHASARRGLRYIDNSAPIHELLVPFTGDEARHAWRSFVQTKQRETIALGDAATKAQHHASMQTLVVDFPAPDVEPDLQLPAQKPISKSNKKER